MEVATFGAGCFWGVELAFRKTKGVTDTAVGYSGGHKEQPTYEEVCSKTTGHAEVVRVTYDPAQITYEELLAVFWNSHDPTQLNRQGPDVGEGKQISAADRHPDRTRQDVFPRRGLPSALP